MTAPTHRMGGTLLSWLHACWEVGWDSAVRNAGLTAIDYNYPGAVHPKSKQRVTLSSFFFTYQSNEYIRK